MLAAGQRSDPPLAVLPREVHSDSSAGVSSDCVWVDGGWIVGGVLPVDGWWPALCEVGGGVRKPGRVKWHWRGRGRLVRVLGSSWRVP